MLVDAWHVLRSDSEVGCDIVVMTGRHCCFSFLLCGLNLWFGFRGEGELWRRWLACWAILSSID